MTTLPLNYPTRPGSKVAGPSEQAASEMKARAATLQPRCLALFTCKPFTADEFAKILGEPVTTIRPRVSELLRMGLIEDSGKRRKNQSGKSATVWKLKGDVQ